MRGLFVAMVVPALGCSSKPESRRIEVGSAAADAGVRVFVPPVPIAPGHYDDDDAAHHVSAPPAAGRNSRQIDVTLRSTPPGAQAAVDGIVIGPTPAFWNGVADGHEHEFTFVLPRHAIARYRFVPITSGVIHARLIPVSEDVDAGVPPPEVVPPSMVPMAPPPDPPLLAPDAGTPNPYGPVP
ncbi:MAG TPA: hypothetical protein VGL61_12325 [Kofleriaceae bacterium]|jgi:hypothetical protein